MADPTTKAFEPRTLFTILRRRARLIAIIVGAAALSAAVLSSMREDEYRATTEVLLVSPVAAAELTDAGRANAIRVIESDLVSDEVDSQLGYRTSLSVRLLSDSDVIALTGINGDPQRAADTANAYAEVYISQRRTRQLEELEQRRGELQESYDTVSDDLVELTAPLAELDAQIAAAITESQITALTDFRDRLDNDISAQRQSLVGQQATFAQQLNELQLARATVATSSGEVLSEAVPPTAPASPVPVRDGIAAALVAAVFAVALAVLLERLDDSVRDIHHLRDLADVPVIGSVPRVDAVVGLVFSTDSGGNQEVAESFRQIRTTLDFVGVSQSVRSIMITSAAAGEGKTTAALNLAGAEASHGRKVLLISADLRRPTIAKRLGIQRRLGLSDVLAGTTTLANAVHRIDESLLHVLTAGQHPPNPAEMLGGGRLDAVVAEAMRHFDLVILDSPPVLPVNDARIIAGSADAVVLVAARRVSKATEYTEALEALELTETPVIGTILNFGDRAVSYYYSDSR
jgi:capsular exopolysaccharide synthesis family protein